MKNLLFLLFLISGIDLSAQVAINIDATAPDNSAMLDVKSTTRGMLVPRMTTIQRNAIASPAPGLLIFCIDNNFYYSNQGTANSPNWVMVNSKWSPVGLGISYSGGNVGIGTTAPYYNLDVQGNGPVINVQATSGIAGLILNKAESTDNSVVICQKAGTSVWAFGTLGNDNFRLYNAGVFGDALAIDQSTNNATYSGRFGIHTAPEYDLHLVSTDYTAAYITSDYPGGTAFMVLAPGAGDTWGLYANAPMTGYAGYFAGNVYCLGSYLPSDERLKENIQPMQDALAKVMKLDVKTYTFKQEYASMNLPTSRQYGFTAQNLEGVFPELVKLNPAKGKEQPIEFKAVNYTGLIPVLTEAIQEQQKLLENKDARIDLLQKQLDDLKALVFSIQQTNRTNSEQK